MRTFYKKSLALITCAAVVAGVLCSCGGSSSTAASSAGDTSASASSGESFTWKLGSVDPESYFMTALTTEWGEEITEKSEGRIQCKMFASGALGSDVSMMESMDAGTLQIWEGGSNVVNMFGKLYDAWGMLYLYDSEEQKYNFWDTHFDEVADLLASETGYRPLAIIDGPYRELTSTIPIDSMDDLNGFKIRVPEISTYMDSWKAAGAAPTAMSFNEVYTSLQTKVIDGQENDILLCESSGFFDVCKNLVMSDHAAYEGFVVIKEDEWQKLPEDLQEIVKEASKNLTSKSRETVKSQVDECLANLEARGDITITYPDTTAFKEAVQSVYAEYPHISEIVDMIRAS